MNDPSDVMGRVRKALGRSAGRSGSTEPATAAIPVPPTIDPAIARLVYAELGLPELFISRSRELKTDATQVAPDELAGQVVAFLQARGLKKVALAGGGLIEKLRLADAIRSAGLHVRTWDELTLDELYDGYDCGITDAAYAVAETGSIVIRPGPRHGRALSLVPFCHIAVLEPRNFVPDLLDLMQRIADEPGTDFTLISGPSKTADIEMNVVVGVHGPNVVRAFVLK